MLVPASGAANLGLSERDRAGAADLMAPQYVAQPRQTTDQSQASEQISPQSLNNTVGY